MSDFAEELKGMSLLLKRIGIRISLAVKLNFLRLNLNGLTAAKRSDKFACHSDARASRNPLEKVFVKSREIYDNLNIIYRGPVVKSDEVDFLVSSLLPGSLASKSLTLVLMIFSISVNIMSGHSPVRLKILQRY